MQIPRSRHLPPAALALALLAAGCATVSGGPRPVTAQRPTLSRDTATTAERTLELETGIALDPTDSFDTPTLVKYGLDRATELFVGLSPYRQLDRPGPDGEGFGDTLIGARHRFWEDAKGATSAAWQVAVKLPTGSESEGLSTGEPDFFAAGILTRKIYDTTLTAFYQLGVLGEEDESASEVDAQHSVALAATQPWTQELSLFGEVAGVLSPEAADLAFTTFGVAYALSPAFVIDVGLAVGLDSDAPDLAVLIGLTTNFGRPY